MSSSSGTRVPIPSFFDPLPSISPVPSIYMTSISRDRIVHLDPYEDMVCATCHSICFPSVNMSCCGKTLCMECLTAWKRASNPAKLCPGCNVAMDIHNPAHHQSPQEASEKRDKQRVASIEVYCAHRESSGCEEKYILGVNMRNEDKHVRECPCRPVKCGNNGCQYQDAAMRLRTHMDTCEYRDITCKTCDVTMTAEDFQSHIITDGPPCQGMKACTLCRPHKRQAVSSSSSSAPASSAAPRYFNAAEMEEHLKNDCEGSSYKCLLCGDMVSVLHRDEHNRKKAVKHISELAVVSLERYNALAARIAELESSSASSSSSAAASTASSSAVSQLPSRPWTKVSQYKFAVRYQELLCTWASVETNCTPTALFPMSGQTFSDPSSFFGFRIRRILGSAGHVSTRGRFKCEIWHTARHSSPVAVRVFIAGLSVENGNEMFDSSKTIPELCSVHEFLTVPTDGGKLKTEFDLFRVLELSKRLLHTSRLDLESEDEDREYGKVCFVVELYQ